MENVSNKAIKRKLDEDDSCGEEKLKTEGFGPNLDNIQVKNQKIWDMLPSIVYNLLVLFTKSEKLNSDDVPQDKMGEDKVLSNENCQEKLSDNTFRHENLEEDKISNTISIEKPNLQVSNSSKDSIQNPINLDLLTSYTTQNVPLITKAVPVTLIAENTDVYKAKQTSGFKKQLTSAQNVCNLSVSTKSVYCTDSTSNDNSKVIKFTKSASSAVKSIKCIYNTPILASTNSNTKIVSGNKTRDLFSSSNREKMLEFLNKNWSNTTSKIPSSKPPPCICKYCTILTSLPKKKSAIYNLLFRPSEELSYKMVHSDMYSSNVPVTDCASCASNDCRCTSKSNTTNKYKKTQINTDSPKNIWINELTSLMNKKECTSEKSLATNKKLRSLPNAQNKVPKATEHAKSHIPLRKKYKRSRF